MEVSLSTPSPSDADEFIDAVRASRSLHHPWIDPPDSSDRFAATSSGPTERTRPPT